MFYLLYTFFNRSYTINDYLCQRYDILYILTKIIGKFKTYYCFRPLKASLCYPYISFLL